LPKTVKPADTATVAAGTAFYKAWNAELKQCNEFRGIIWKLAKKAAFATRDNWTVVWIEYQTEVPLVEAGTWASAPRATIAVFGAEAWTAGTRDATKNKANVLKKCMKDGYNECIVNAEFAKHNDARLARKDTPALTHDKKASVKIQAMLNDKTKKYAEDSAANFKDLAALAGDDFKNCIQTVFLGTYTSGTSTATDAWLLGSADITDNSVIPTTLTDVKKQLAYAFAMITAKAGQRVGFGQKGQAFVAWYCSDTTPQKASVAIEGTDFYKAEGCIKTLGALKINGCFNTAAAKEVNALRTQHKVIGYKATFAADADADVKSAAALKIKLDAATSCPAGRDATAIAAPDAACVDLYYVVKETDKSHAAIAKAMTKEWYALKSKYDITVGKTKDAIAKASAGADLDKSYYPVAGFTGMLWKGGTAADTWAGYAVKSGCAMARFCATPAVNVLLAADVTVDVTFKKNVLKQCIDTNGVDFCFTKHQLTKMNDSRKLRKDTADLAMDDEGNK
jgi:hypothetical protein